MNSIKLLYFSILYTYYFPLCVCAFPLPGVLSSLPKYGLIPTKSRRSLQRSPQSHSLISLIWHRSSRTEDRTPITGLYSYFQTLHPPFVPCPVAKAHTALLSFKRPCDNAAAVLIRHYRPPEKWSLIFPFWMPFLTRLFYHTTPNKKARPSHQGGKAGPKRNQKRENVKRRICCCFNLEERLAISSLSHH